MVKRVIALSLLVFLLLSPFLLSSSFKNVESAEAATATSGPVGRNGLRAYPGPGKGEITLEWGRASLYGENYQIHYGNASGKYIYQTPQVGYIATYTVKSLRPGSRYYFALEGFTTGNVTRGWDGEVSAVAPGSSVTVQGTAGPVGRNSLKAASGPKSGEVTLTWWKFYDDTTGYDIVYGEAPGQYRYGAANAVEITNSKTYFTFTVGALKSGRRYYFALLPKRTGTQGGAYVTSEVSVVAR